MDKFSEKTNQPFTEMWSRFYFTFSRYQAKDIKKLQHGGIAQLEEQQAVNLKVVGANPTISVLSS